MAESRFYPCVTALTMVVGISAGREHGQFAFFNSGIEGVAESRFYRCVTDDGSGN